MPYSPNEQNIYDAAMKFAKANKNKTQIAKEKVDAFPQEENPDKSHSRYFPNV